MDPSSAQFESESEVAFDSRTQSALAWGSARALKFKSAASNQSERLRQAADKCQSVLRCCRLSRVLGAQQRAATDRT